jgi:hypothetical protein
MKAAGSASSALDGLREVTSLGPTRHHQINLDIKPAYYRHWYTSILNM